MLEYVKDFLHLTGTVKQSVALFTVVMTFVVPKAFRDIPATTIVVTVSSISSSKEARFFNLNLSVMLKCFAPQSDMCSRDVIELVYPGISEPVIQVPGDFKQNFESSTSLERDRQGRTIHQIRLLRPQKGGDTIFINTGINGRIVVDDLKFQNTTGENILGARFKCRDERVQPPSVMQINCSERITLWERIRFLLPFAS